MKQIPCSNWLLKQKGPILPAQDCILLSSTGKNYILDGQDPYFFFKYVGKGVAKMGRRQPKQEKHEQLSLLYCALSQLSKETVILDAEQGKTSLLYNKSFMDQVYLMARY